MMHTFLRAANRRPEWPFGKVMDATRPADTTEKSRSRRLCRSHGDRDQPQSGFSSEAHKRKSLPREEARQAFRKEPNSDWEEECRRSYRRPWEEERAV